MSNFIIKKKKTLFKKFLLPFKDLIIGGEIRNHANALYYIPSKSIQDPAKNRKNVFLTLQVSVFQNIQISKKNFKTLFPT